MGINKAIIPFLPLFTIILAACLLCSDIAGGLSFHLLTAPIVTAFLLSWPTTILPRHFRGPIQLLLGELFILICLVDAWCLISVESHITPQILSNILLSNSREIKEYVSAFVDWHVLSHWQIIGLLFLALLFPLSLLPRINMCLCVIHKKVCLAGWGLLLLSMVTEIRPAYHYVLLYKKDLDVTSLEGLIFRHYHEEVPTPLHRLFFAYYSLNQSAQVLEGIKGSTYAAQIDSCSHQSPHIVLIIGESYNKHHSTLYGYSLPTTPLQQRRKNKGELFVFQDVITRWNITSNVFLDIFSMWEQGVDISFCESPLFPVFFRQAGYAVNFFSNQFLLRGFRKGATNQAGHFFLADTELSNRLFSHRNRRSDKYDMGIIKQVIDYKNDNVLEDYSLDIIHLRGQHFEYEERYPHDEAAFTLQDYQDRLLSDEAQRIVMHYDNATAYNDLVVDSLLTFYEQEEAVVIYVSDHGEEVYDDLPIYGRLFQQPTSEQAHQEYEIPMWIWCSESYRSKHPALTSHIQESANKPFMTDGLPHLLLALAGISCPWTCDSQNILSSHYLPRQRIICGTVDYDNLMR